MRNDLPALVLSRDEHVEHINRHWSRDRVRRADEVAADVLFDEDLRRVGIAMAEPEPPSEKRAGHMLGAVLLNSLLWASIVVIALEILRP